MLKSIFALFGSKTGYQNLNSAEFEAKMKESKNAVLLDVRTKAEFREVSIPGAKNIDIMGTAFSEQVQKMDREKTYFVYCRSGGRSGRACKTMSGMGFEKVYNLSGGIMSWRGKTK